MTTITFLGDVFLPRAYQVHLKLDAPFVFNLEYPITSATVGWPGKVVNLRADANHIPQTFTSPPAAVCLANNHIMDFGTRGFEETLEELKRSGIRAFGAGTLENNQRNPLILEESGVALLGTPVPLRHRSSQLRTIRALRGWNWSAWCGRSPRPDAPARGA